MSNEFDEVLTKLSPKERELLSLEIGQAVADAMAAQETARAEAADPETIRQANLAKMYAATPEKTAPIKNRQLEAATAWSRGERWPSTAKYPSMDYEAMDKARAAAKGEDK